MKKIGNLKWTASSPAVTSKLVARSSQTFNPHGCQVPSLWADLTKLWDPLRMNIYIYMLRSKIWVDVIKCGPLKLKSNTGC